MNSRYSRRQFVIQSASVGAALTFLPHIVHGQDSTIRIAASTPLIADIVRNIAGDQAEVMSVMPESADPHTWEANPQDIVRATEADAFIYVGAHLEPFIEAGGWRRAMRDAAIPEFAIADHIELIVVDKVIDHGDHVHDLRGGDPHFWLDPRKVIEAAPAIRDFLAGLFPDLEPGLLESTSTYIDELTTLDADMESTLAAIPEDRRKLIVFHDAYTYFAARYDFEVAGIVLKQPDIEVSARELVELQETIREFGINVIFAEPQFNTSVLDLLVEETGVTIGELLTDAFADRTDSNVGLMTFNRDSLMTHLGNDG